MGGSSSNLQDKHVVIVGGGYAGTALATNLKGKCKMTLIDPKDAMHHSIAAPRALVERGYGKLLFVPYAPTYGDSFKQGKVVGIDKTAKKVKLETGDEIPYDYLVIATGTAGRFPTSVDPSMTDTSQGTEMYNSFADKVNAATNIVIIGGGPVGIEVAGELVTDTKDKKITIIHSKSELIDNGIFTDKFRRRLRNKLDAMGVDILFEHKVTNLDELPTDGSARCQVQTDKGTMVEADLVFVCIGLKTNTSAYAESFSDKLDVIGCLKVDEFLRVEGCTDIFAIGDCSTADDIAKMAYKAFEHVNTVAKNIQLQEAGRNLKPYKRPFNAMFVSLGRNDGVAQMRSMVLPGFMGKYKSKDFFTPKFWNDMGQKVPSN